MKKYILGNIKMNMDIKDTENYIETFLPHVQNCKNEVILFPSFTNLMYVKQKLTASKVQLGAQNVASEPSGEYTGEVSSSMLKGVGCQYVLIGHSERRRHFYEKNDQINKKIKEALGSGLKVVLCVGESKYERQNKKHITVLNKDLAEALKGLYENELNNILIAYEPVWSIGTGKLPSQKEVEEAVQIIRTKIKTEFSDKAAKNIKILYGGSVNSQNIKQFSEVKGVNGFLVGGASLKPLEFAKICNS